METLLWIVGVCLLVYVVHRKYRQYKLLSARKALFAQLERSRVDACKADFCATEKPADIVVLKKPRKVVKKAKKKAVKKKRK